ncbi:MULTISPECIES: DUF465 domain-containing protein [unclassified Photobacterium]|uniref:DUF465 domain-containing protein n=1 Tax=unclassified Photobacterium TaxID=2628852 RepID=UPI000D164FD7|nr:MULTISPECIES: DUF465 domain-containing protein [unclassified Photobacterium]PSV26387.1 hypothetical protein C9J42_11855 [Photobacterium sp. GB-56]PSV36785.1 hypothetical protein C9J38_12485 [Photobacterium sp. GB-210]PSV46036.1 hypothetical protein C9J46_05880 [Photobacterium sp. GB-36]PSV52493.1 hypothetical protein C9J45_11390 [Photobacterium sp. GB-1]PSV52926.1 hypothetical protein C9J43_19345 [Photobacterium sp. GB-3]
MFPEYKELIDSLKGKEVAFDRLYNKHSELNAEIEKMTAKDGYDEDVIDKLKKEKLLLKDEILAYLKSVEAK